MNKKKTIFAKLGWVGLGLCGVCCTLPIIGIILGLGSLTTVAFYFEKAALGFFILAGLFFSLYLYKRKNKHASCDINCSCKDKAKAQN